MLTKATRFWGNESGATAIEYGLIASIVSLAIIAGLTVIGTQLTANYTKIGTGLTIK